MYSNGGAKFQESCRIASVQAAREQRKEKRMVCVSGRRARDPSVVLAVHWTGCGAKESVVFEGQEATASRLRGTSRGSVAGRLTRVVDPVSRENRSGRDHREFDSELLRTAVSLSENVDSGLLKGTFCLFL